MTKDGIEHNSSLHKLFNGMHFVKKSVNKNQKTPIKLIEVFHHLHSSIREKHEII
jgi:hypothetical protein